MINRQMHTVRSQMPVRRRMSDEEHRMQCACVRWFRLQYPHLRHNLFAVPNGGRRDKASAARLKEEGVLAGVADLILLLPNHQYGALLIEMKTEDGRQSPEQREWQRLIEHDGYRYVVCRSVDQFISIINEYVEC